MPGLGPGVGAIYPTTVFLVSIGLLSLALYLATEAGYLQRSRQSFVGSLTVWWSWVTVFAVVGVGVLLRAPVWLTPLVDFAPVLLVASVTPAAIGFVTYAQIAAINVEDRPTAIRATVAQAVAFINVVASVATLLMFFGFRR